MRVYALVALAWSPVCTALQIRPAVTTSRRAAIGTLFAVPSAALAAVNPFDRGEIEGLKPPVSACCGHT